MPAFGQMQPRPPDPRVDILFNFHQRTFELPPCRAQSPFGAPGHIALLNFARHLATLPIARYRSVATLTLIMFGIAVFFGVLTLILPIKFCIYLTSVLTLAFLACLVTLGTDCVLFRSRVARIVAKYASAKPKLTLVSQIGLTQFFACSFLRRDPKFCTVSVEVGEGKGPRSFWGRANQRRYEEELSARPQDLPDPASEASFTEDAEDPKGLFRTETAVQIRDPSDPHAPSNRPQAAENVREIFEMTVSLDITNDLLLSESPTPTGPDVNFPSTKELLNSSSLSDSHSIEGPNPMAVAMAKSP